MTGYVMKLLWFDPWIDYSSEDQDFGQVKGGPLSGIASQPRSGGAFLRVDRHSSSSPFRPGSLWSGSCSGNIPLPS